MEKHENMASTKPNTLIELHKSNGTKSGGWHARTTQVHNNGREGSVTQDK